MEGLGRGAVADHGTVADSGTMVELVEQEARAEPAEPAEQGARAELNSTRVEQVGPKIPMAEQIQSGH